MKTWKIGDRVTRPIYMDDGTWAVQGDKCLPGPLKHGRVVGIGRSVYGDTTYAVEWDPHESARPTKSLRQNNYLSHGLAADPTQPMQAVSRHERFFVEHGAWHDRKTGRHLHDIVADHPARDRLGVLLTALSDHDQTPAEAMAELEEDGVDVDAFLDGIILATQGSAP